MQHVAFFQPIVALIIQILNVSRESNLIILRTSKNSLNEM
jgi:hypothetical protein